LLAPSSGFGSCRIQGASKLAHSKAREQRSQKLRHGPRHRQSGCRVCIFPPKARQPFRGISAQIRLRFLSRRDKARQPRVPFSRYPGSPDFGVNRFPEGEQQESDSRRISSSPSGKGRVTDRRPRVPGNRYPGLSCLVPSGQKAKPYLSAYAPLRSKNQSSPKLNFFTPSDRRQLALQSRARSGGARFVRPGAE